MQEERLRRGDDLRLQMALEESRRDTVKFPKKKEVGGFLRKEFSELTGWVGQIRNGASIATFEYLCMHGRQEGLS